jgi:BirA family biotin operon repressor/biotin-[acetyl-CoA-carboxylase] ligase
MQSVDSTNNYALAQVHAGLAPHGTTFFAHEQWAGKGQRGKTWLAEKGSSLILSVVIDPKPLSITQQFQLSACVAVSFCEFFSRYAGDDTSIKWPNDIYWQDRKAGGILIENVIGTNTWPPIAIGEAVSSQHQSQWRWAIAGIGVNINQPSFHEELKNPVSLRQITGKTFDTLELAKELCLILDQHFNELIDAGFDHIYQLYTDHLYKKGQQVRFKKGPRSFEATVINVSPEGRLIVQHATEEEFIWGEVEWIIPQK